MEKDKKTRSKVGWFYRPPKRPLGFKRDLDFAQLFVYTK